MQRKIETFFMHSAGILLIITALAKLISSFGIAHILQAPDPIFKMAFQRVFWLVGSIELAIALVCLLSKRVGLRAGFVAWLATSFLVYRVGLEWVGYHKPCSCMGNLTDALHFPPQIADVVMKLILTYLLLGSYGILFHHWWKRRAEERLRNDEIKPESGIDG